jgi:hypothetical protein
MRYTYSFSNGTSFAGDPIPILYTMLQLILMQVLKLRGINANRALLRNYGRKICVLFGTLLPFDDFRRIRATDGDIAMPIPIKGTYLSRTILIAQDGQ